MCQEENNIAKAEKLLEEIRTLKVDLEDMEKVGIVCKCTPRYGYIDIDLVSSHADKNICRIHFLDKDNPDQDTIDFAEKLAEDLDYSVQFTLGRYKGELSKQIQKRKEAININSY